MGGHGRESRRTAASAISDGIQREIAIADGHLAALRTAVTAGLAKASAAKEEQERIAGLKVELDAAWKRAKRSIERLEALSGRIESHAREALKKSQSSAKDAFEGLWTLVTTPHRSE